MTTLTIYCFLPVVTALYALLLSRLPKRDPDFTWATVIVGVGICLLAPALDQRNNGPLTSELYEWRVWQAFLLGGAPIVIWRVSATVRAYHRLLKRIISRIYGNTTDQAAPLADQRRGNQETDD
jgi:hypothetical protein